MSMNKLNVRFPSLVVERINAISESMGITASETARMAILMGLSQLELTATNPEETNQPGDSHLQQDLLGK